MTPTKGQQDSTGERRRALTGETQRDRPAEMQHVALPGVFSRRRLLEDKLTAPCHTPERLDRPNVGYRLESRLQRNALLEGVGKSGSPKKQLLLDSTWLMRQLLGRIRIENKEYRINVGVGQPH